VSVLSSLKDTILDRFGVLDDVDDFFDFIDREARDLEKRLSTAKRVIESLKREIISARNERDINSRRTEDLEDILEDISDRLRSVKREVSSAESKAKRDPDIWEKVEGAFSKLSRSVKIFSTSLDDTRANIQVLKRDQKAVIEALQTKADASKEKRAFASTAGRLVGMLAAVIGSVTVLGRLL